MCGATLHLDPMALLKTCPVRTKRSVPLLFSRQAEVFDFDELIQAVAGTLPAESIAVATWARQGISPVL